MLELLVIGECVADIVRRPDEADRVHPGGSPANVAHGLARLGRPVTLHTQLGADEEGRLITAHLASAGVAVRTDGSPGPTPKAVVTLDAGGRATYDFDIHWTLAPVPDGTAPDHVHTGSLAAVMAPGADTVLARVASLRASATVSYDPNVRPELMGDHAGAVRRVEECVALADVVKASDEDLGWLYPDRTPDEVARGWLESDGPALVLVTRGGEGAYAVTRRAGARIGAFPARVVDTVGAGDAFMAGALHALAARGLLGPDGRAGLRAIGEPALTDVLRHGAAAASVAVGRAGADPPDNAELRAALG
ncbi:carbohydrate kinase [uncultured Streptomyces sp.]|uniref:carbohydrate kinase family protein n=1 Tax=uncultured Streptomyces sp. TaxID=174707 RepID=UPI002623261B|nr:carbohydrate kinase [uncultured Streptomyces sp.]